MRTESELFRPSPATVFHAHAVGPFGRVGPVAVRRGRGHEMSAQGGPSDDVSFERLITELAGPGGDPLDERYWATVASAFPLAGEFVVLGSVARGVVPSVVLDQVDAESRRANAYQRRRGDDPSDRIRVSVAELLGSTVETTALVRNTTEGVTTVLLHWPLSRGDEVVCSAADHGPFLETLSYRAARDGIVVRQVTPPVPAGSLDEIVDAYAAVIGPRTRLVLVPQVMLYGQLMPVRAIADLVHARGGHILVDGVLAVGHVPVDVAAMDCDFFAAGFHKWGMGPRGTAAFVVRAELIPVLPRRPPPRPPRRPLGRALKSKGLSR